jgi:hypothetical protein
VHRLLECPNFGIGHQPERGMRVKLPQGCLCHSLFKYSSMLEPRHQ